MYGLDKKKTTEGFQFDLEIEMKKDPKKAKERLAHIEKTIASVKEAMKKTSGKKETEELNTLLQGYTSLFTVLQRTVK